MKLESYPKIIIKFKKVKILQYTILIKKLNKTTNLDHTCPAITPVQRGYGITKIIKYNIVDDQRKRKMSYKVKDLIWIAYSFKNNYFKFGKASSRLKT